MDLLKMIHEKAGGFQGGGVVIDVGSGSGQVLAGFAQALSALYSAEEEGEQDEFVFLCVDISASLLEQGRSAWKSFVAEHGGTGDCATVGRATISAKFVVGSGSNFGELAKEHCGADCKVQLVTVATAYHWFDHDAFARSLASCATPGYTSLLIWTYGMHSLATETPQDGAEPFVESAIDDIIFNRLYNKLIFEYWPPQIEHVRNGYVNLPFPYPREPVPSMSLQKEWTVDNLLGYLRSWSGVQRYRDANDNKDPVSMIEADLRQTWADKQCRTVTWPLTVLSGTCPAE